MSNIYPNVGIAIIAKNEEATLPHLLESISGHIDYAVLADTGSKDNTKQLFIDWAEALKKEGKLKDYSAIDFEWVDHFAKARQAAWDELYKFGDVHYGTWADCDDVIEGAEHFRAVASDAFRRGVRQILFPYNYAQDEKGNCICRLERERLIKLNSGEQWMLPVHEVLRIEAPGERREEIVWVHRHKASKFSEVYPNKEEAEKALAKFKAEGKNYALDEVRGSWVIAEETITPNRNYRILKKEYDKHKKEGKEDPRSTVYLGTELMALGKHVEAIPYFIEYLRIGTWDEELCQAAAKLSQCYFLEQDFESAENAATTSIRHRPDWADGYYAMAQSLSARQKPQEALRFAEIGEHNGVPDTLLIINPLDYHYQAAFLKGTIYTQLGQGEKAVEYTRKALELVPYRTDLLEQYNQLTKVLKVDKTARAYMNMVEVLMRHDETLKAKEFALRSTPYFIEALPEMFDTRLKLRENVIHSTDQDAYEEFYEQPEIEARFGEAGQKIEDVPQIFSRAEYLMDQIEQLKKETGKDSLRVLDLSGNDGWMVAYLASKGHHADMMDMNPGAVKSAAQRKKEYPKLGRFVADDLHNAPKHFDPGTYDIVVLFETIEHVQDPKKTYAVATSMLNDNGLFCISTPNCAYEEGNVDEWDRAEPKGHLRVFRPNDLARDMSEIGIIRHLDIGKDNVLFASVKPSPRKGKVAFFLGTVEARPEKIITEGLGGSETAAVKLAEHFARKGYDTTVFSGLNEGALRGDSVTVADDIAEAKALLDIEEPGSEAYKKALEKVERLRLEELMQARGQVVYQPYTLYDPDVEYDLLVLSRQPEMLDYTHRAKKTVLWLHDAEYGPRLSAKRLKRADDIVVLSDFQKDLFVEQHEYKDPEVADLFRDAYVSRNGIETRWYQEESKNKKQRVVYFSSPDRGLDVLLKLWPRIKEKVPEAELHHAYAPVYHQFKDMYSHLQKFHAKLEEFNKSEGIVSHGSMNQKELAEFLKESKVWAYPSFTSWANNEEGALFPEISCILAMEVQAAGVVPVVLDYGALQENVKSGIKVPGYPKTEEWENAFVESVVKVLQSGDLDKFNVREGRDFAMSLDWSGVCDDWENRWIKTEQLVLV